MNQSSMPANVGSMEGLGVIERAEWQRRYAARIMERAGWDECPAIAAAEAGAEAHEESERGCGNAVVWCGGAARPALTTRLKMRLTRK